MPYEVVMPKLGGGMEMGSLVEWLKRDGEAVNAGEMLFTVESDKAVSEVDALESGILRIPPDAPTAGQQVPVGTVLGYLLKPGEAMPVSAATRPEVDNQASAVPEQVAVGPVPSRVSPAASPRARRLAAELGVNWTELAGSGRTGRVIERDVRAACRHGERKIEDMRISPLARRLAEQAGIGLSDLKDRAVGRRITREDVEAVIRERTVGIPPTGMEEPAFDGSIPSSRSSALRTEPLSAARRVTRDRMADAARATAAVTLVLDADATNLVELRNRLVPIARARNSLNPPRYTDLLIRVVACALVEHPHLNASLDGDHLVLHEDVHVGLAVDTPRGLVVPVIRRAQAKGIWAIAEESSRLIEQATSGTIAVEDLRGSTFTITNLGPFDIRAFTPILNLPECAILGVGRVALRPVVDDSGERIVPRHTVTLSLTFDHRVVDGAPAARFLQSIKQYIEEPLLWLAR
ncbi:MAG: 2-oxo acid dehydrogenase subunit E2 [Dehalococcoidales bacterium]|nr:2-oxo acid dehydrogenase subunit E2 [Dehalococcoidales bacterium]